MTRYDDFNERKEREQFERMQYEARLWMWTCAVLVVGVVVAWLWGDISRWFDATVLAYGYGR